MTKFQSYNHPVMYSNNLLQLDRCKLVCQYVRPSDLYGKGDRISMNQDRGFLMDEPTWSQRVKTVRLRLHITQVELADRLGMSEAGVVAWEMRDRRPWSEESDKFLKLEEELETEEAS